MSVEHLFKLKKDGKTVGYLLLQDGYLQLSENGKNYFYIHEQNPAGSLSYIRTGFDVPFWLDWDTAHPFVIKDKNGKDVFAGDEVKAGSWEFEVIWQKYGYGLKGIKHGWWRQFNEFGDIELIEDKEDE